MACGFLVAPTFTQWLLQRPAGFESLVDFALADHARRGRPVRAKCWPSRAQTLLPYVRHVRERHAGDPAAPSERDVRAAFVAFERALAGGVRFPARSRRLPVEQRRAAVNYTVAAATAARVRALADEFGTQGAVIDMLVERFDALRREVGDAASAFATIVDGEQRVDGTEVAVRVLV